MTKKEKERVFVLIKALQECSGLLDDSLCDQEGFASLVRGSAYLEDGLCLADDMEVKI